MSEEINENQGPENFKVMVVDDSKLSRKVLIQGLKDFEEIETRDYEDPIQALAELEAYKPDLIISDCEMPNMDGIEFLKRIRSDKTFGKLPFMMISGIVDLDFKAKVIDLGVNEAFAKGFESKDLNKCIERYIRQKNGGQSYAVLIVDDSKLNRMIFRKMMTDLNFTLFEAEDPIVADRVLEEHPIDLIISDNEMPNKNGVVWCSELRKKEETKNLSIIGISSTKEIALTFLSAGADDFMQKPIVKEEVEVKVKQQLRRVDLERELQAGIDREKTLNHQKNVLLGTAAHDIRNPIAAIMSYLSLVEDMKYDDEDTNFVISNCTKLAENAMELLNDILDASNISSGSLSLTFKQFDLVKLIDNRVEEQKVLSKGKNISITSEFVGLVDNTAMAKVDVKRLSQVIDNLLSNAIKYSHKDTAVTVKLSNESDGWLIEVIDQGQGIPESEVDGVFSEFQKTSVQTTAGESSTGLGLAIVKKIIDAHGGTIWAESTVGKGSSFIFKLPNN